MKNGSTISISISNYSEVSSEKFEKAIVESEGTNFKYKNGPS